MQRKFTTFSRTTLQTPHEEIRINVPASNPWFRFLEENEDVLKVYNLIINHIISDIHGTSLDELRTILRYKFAIPHEIVEDTIQFIITNETKFIEFEEKENSTIRLPIIYRKPRNHVAISGEYSIWKASNTLRAQPIGEI